MNAVKRLDGSVLIGGSVCDVPFWHFGQFRMSARAVQSIHKSNSISIKATLTHGLLDDMLSIQMSVIFDFCTRRKGRSQMDT